MIALLGTVSTICGLIIVTADMVTAATIRNNLAQIRREAVGDVLPGTTVLVKYAVDPAAGTVTEAPEGDAKGPEPNLFACFEEDGAGRQRFLGLVCEASGKGYGGAMKVLYAYSPDKEAIIGFKVIESKETPGLGDKILFDEAFLANFEELEVRLDGAGGALAHPIETVKHGTKTARWQVDAISGATVSSRAVGEMLNSSAERMLPLIRRHLDDVTQGGT